MSKSSTATAPKIPTQLSTKSAWAKGPPQNTSNAPSPRSQSPTPSNATPPHLAHSRRASNLGQGIPIKDGVSVPRSNVGAVKQGSAVTFGSIDDVSALISSSPSTAPSIKSEVVKSFGTVPASLGHINGKSSISTSSKSSTMTSTSGSSVSTPPPTPSKTGKLDIAKLFQNPGSSSAPSSHPPPSDTASPSIRAVNLPSQPQQHQPSPSQHQQGQPHPPNSQPSQLGSHPYTPFVPGGGGLRPQQQNGPGAGPGSGPRSPVYSRQMTNGNGPRPSGGPNGPVGGPPAMSTGLSSPRLTSHPHPGPPSGMPPPPQAVHVPWSGYFYPPEHYMPPYSPGWYVPQHPLPHQHQPHQHHPPPPGQPGPPQHSGMPMSPRHPPPPLQQPSTPTQAHAMPIHTPQPTTSHSSSNSITGVPSNSIAGMSSPPPTPSTTSGPNGARLNTNANTFVPKGKVTIKNAEGMEVDLDALKKSPAAPASPGGFNASTNRRSVIRMESEEARQKRLGEEQERSREKERAKQEAEDRVKKEKEEEERREREEELRKQKEKEEEEEKERIRKEEEEREWIRKVVEEKQEAEKKRLLLEEAERQKKAEEEKEKERLRKEEEEREREKEKEKERLLKEEAEMEQRRKEEEDATAASSIVEADMAALESDEIEEEGEIEVEMKMAETTKPKDRDLRIDTTATTSAPITSETRRRPGPLDLSYASKANVSAPLPSALATARIIDDLGSVQYPEGVMSPKVELNINAKDGKFRYDREFLLQFMSICTEKPDMLPPLDAIGLESSDQAISRGGSGRHRQASTSSGPPQPSTRQPPVGLGFNAPSFAKSGAPNPFMGNMGNFATLGTKLSSEERFAMANNGRSASVGGPTGLPFGRPSPMVRTASQGGPGGTPGSMPSNRTRSKRGVPRDNVGKVGSGSGGAGGSSSQQGHGSTSGPSGSSGSLGSGGMFEPIVPLEQSANRWVPVSTSRKVAAVDLDSPEIVDRKVKGLLNKLTMEKFDPISDQIIAWANRSEKEKDGRTLIQVIRLVFEKATDEATWSEMYARLCRKMMEQISSKVQDDGIKNAEGKPIAGGQLFRKYLLNRCQEDFERGWVAKEATAAAAATKAMEDQAAKAANEKSSEDNAGDEVELYSEEYYAAQKAKRQGLGLIKFIGELFKLQMLTERIMHECVKKLLGNVKNPEEEEIESLCKLLSTVGSILDTNKARAHMDVYFSRMKELTKSPNVSSRMQFMLQDVTELRERRWVTRNLVAAPTTIAQIHENAAKEKAAAEKDYNNRQISMSRGGSRRGGDRGAGVDGPDGWAVAGGSGPPRPPPKAGDLSNFGKITKTTAMTFGPSSVFAGKKESGKREPLSRTNSSQNMFSMLSQNPEAAGGDSSASKTSHSRKTSADISHSGAPEPLPQRKRLILQPRSKPAAEETAPVPESESSSEDEAVEIMSESEAVKKINEDSKEFFGVRNLEEAEVYFTNLPAQHRFRLVDKLVSSAIESKESDAQLVGDFFSRAAAKGLCYAATFEEGFMPVAESLDDIAIDAPKAFNFMAIMMIGAGLDKDEERRTRIVSKSSDDRLLALLS